ncbi:unnamed protein product [Moneuplotes crassus]|uniref:Kelch motif family protein n=1 Tax=Euplotes crassus TaxID=5936 RepID=A0AAD1XTJ6_EUPCR|nr:unnamed protein product [Moneuplotes crassus]
MASIYDYQTQETNKIGKSYQTNSVDEYCPSHRVEYVAYDQDTGELLCNCCIYEKRSENLVFNAVVAKRLQEIYEEKFNMYKESLSRMQGLSSRLVSTKLQESMKGFFANLKGHIRKVYSHVLKELRNSKNLQEINQILRDAERCFSEKQALGFTQKRDSFMDFISKGQFTTIAMNKSHYDDIIKMLDEQSSKLEAVAKETELRMTKILKINKNPQLIQQKMHEIVDKCMEIDPGRSKTELQQLKYISQRDLDTYKPSQGTLVESNLTESEGRIFDIYYNKRSDKTHESSKKSIPGQNEARNQQNFNQHPLLSSIPDIPSNFGSTIPQSTSNAPQQKKNNPAPQKQNIAPQRQNITPQRANIPSQVQNIPQQRQQMTVQRPNMAHKTQNVAPQKPNILSQRQNITQKQDVPLQRYNTIPQAHKNSATTAQNAAAQRIPNPASQVAQNIVPRPRTVSQSVSQPQTKPVAQSKQFNAPQAAQNQRPLAQIQPIQRIQPKQLVPSQVQRQAPSQQNLPQRTQQSSSQMAVSMHPRPDVSMSAKPPAGVPQKPQTISARAYQVSSNVGMKDLMQKQSQASGSNTGAKPPTQQVQAHRPVVQSKVQADTSSSTDDISIIRELQSHSKANQSKSLESQQDVIDLTDSQTTNDEEPKSTGISHHGETQATGSSIGQASKTANEQTNQHKEHNLEKNEPHNSNTDQLTQNSNTVQPEMQFEEEKVSFSETHEKKTPATSNFADAFKKFEWHFRQKASQIYRIEADGSQTALSTVKTVFLPKSVYTPDKRVFLLGGALDHQIKETVDHCVEMNFSNSSMQSFERAPMPIGKASFGCTLSQDHTKIYIAGGYKKDNVVTNTVEVYHIDTDTWTSLPNMSNFKCSSALCEYISTDGSRWLYSFGGLIKPSTNTGVHLLPTIERINLDKADSWEELNVSFPINLCDSGAMQIDPRTIMIYGGWNQAATPSVHLFHPENEVKTVIACRDDGNLQDADFFLCNGSVGRISNESSNVRIVGHNHTHDFNLVTRKFKTASS